MKIIVDAMGGDYAPQAVIEGVVQAVREWDLQVILVGDEEKIKFLLNKYRYPKEKIQFYPATEVIGMSETPALSVKKKRDSSIVVGLEMLKQGKGDAFFSAGNTGAVVCASALILDCLESIERPGIAIHIPTLKEKSILIDVGANIDPKPIHLLHYAIMAKAYFETVLNKNNPSIGLLNIGEEESKGTELMRHTYQLLSESNVNFLGNIEGKDLFSGKCDIIICDGFVGNIALKISESMLEFARSLLKKSLMNNPLGFLGWGLMSLTSGRTKHQVDYTEYGGALLLGINGVVIIGHGRSNPKAIKNAIRVAQQEVTRQVNTKILNAIRNNYEKK